jgi:hypothetical protein
MRRTCHSITLSGSGTNTISPASKITTSADASLGLSEDVVTFTDERHTISVANDSSVDLLIGFFVGAQENGQHTVPAGESWSGERSFTVLKLSASGIGASDAFRIEGVS